MDEHVECDRQLKEAEDRIEELEGELVEVKRARNIEQGAWEEVKKYQDENKWLRERIEELEDALTRIDTWAKAYPLEAFPEPDFRKAAQVLKAAGMSLDAISASNMRHVINGVKDIAKQALEDK